MSRTTVFARIDRPPAAPREALPTPLVWTFDGPFERCLADIEDTLRRAIVLIGDVSRLALLIELSLPALQRARRRRRPLQPAWGRFLDRLARTDCRPAARAPAARRRPAGDARHRLPTLNPESHHVPEVVGPRPCPSNDGLAGRPDLPPREPGFQPSRAAFEPAAEPREESPCDRSDGSADDVEHLGAYGPLIAAIRDELEHFVASHVRLHVVIADHDRFVLTSIGMRCAARRRTGAVAAVHARVQARAGQALSGARSDRRLAQRFRHRPVAVRRSVRCRDARPKPTTASTGISSPRLRTPPPASAQRRYEVSIVGRWTEVDASRPAAASRAAADPRPAGASPSTPLVGPRCEFDIVDADGRRRVALPAVVRGRRYAIGKGEGCDIEVNGAYTSRRHAEIWLDSDGWWVADVGSTNGMRVEAQGPAPSRARPTRPTANRDPLASPMRASSCRRAPKARRPTTRPLPCERRRRSPRDPPR